MSLKPTGPVVIGHSWVTRLKFCNVLPDYFSYIDLPGGKLNSLADVLVNLPTHQNNDYVFLLLGGNDLDDCWDHWEVRQLQEKYVDFVALLRTVFPYAKVITAQIEVRFRSVHGLLVEDLDFRRKGAKFNKWLNTFDNKDKLLPIRGANFFSPVIWYRPDGVHLNEAGNIKLAGLIENQYVNRMAG